jgi:hypothetical protein
LYNTRTTISSIQAVVYVVPYVLPVNGGHI